MWTLSKTFTIIFKKHIFFVVEWNFGDSRSYYRGPKYKRELSLNPKLSTPIVSGNRSLSNSNHAQKMTIHKFQLVSFSESPILKFTILNAVDVDRFPLVGLHFGNSRSLILVVTTNGAGYV